MKKSWIDDILKLKPTEILEENYYLRCFAGITIILLGFRTNDLETTKKIIYNRDGLITESLEEAEVIVIKNQSVFGTEYSKLLEPHYHKIVTEKWIEACVTSDAYLLFKDYLISKESLKTVYENLTNTYKMVKNDLIQAVVIDPSSISANFKSNISPIEYIIFFYFLKILVMIS